MNMASPPTMFAGAPLRYWKIHHDTVVFSRATDTDASLLLNAPGHQGITGKEIQL